MEGVVAALREGTTVGRKLDGAKINSFEDNVKDQIIEFTFYRFCFPSTVQILLQGR